MSGIRGEKYIDENGDVILTGGLLAAETNKERYGEDWYHKIGTIGGSKTSADGVVKGFAAMPLEKRQAAGRKGGKRSTRTGIRNGEGKPRVKDPEPRLKWPWSK